MSVIAIALTKNAAGNVSAAVQPDPVASLAALTTARTLAQNAVSATIAQVNITAAIVSAAAITSALSTVAAQEVLISAVVAPHAAVLVDSAVITTKTQLRVALREANFCAEGRSDLTS